MFRVNAVDAAGAVGIRRQVRRAQMPRFFSRLSLCLIGLEACAGAHPRARDLAKLGHEVRLIPPSCVKPFVKRGKTDAADLPLAARMPLDLLVGQPTGTKVRIDATTADLPSPWSPGPMTFPWESHEPAALNPWLWRD